MKHSEAVRYSAFEHVVCGFLLACILFATVFLFMQNSWGISPNAVSKRPVSSSSTPMVWYPVGPTHTAAPQSSSTQMVVYPTTDDLLVSSLSSSSSSTLMIWYAPVSSSSVSSSAVASLSSSSSFSSSSSAGLLN